MANKKKKVVIQPVYVRRIKRNIMQNFLGYKSLKHNKNWQYANDKI